MDVFNQFLTFIDWMVNQVMEKMVDNENNR